MASTTADDINNKYC